MANENLVRNITVNIATQGDVRAIAALARLEQAQAAVLRATTSAARATTTMGTAMKGANDNTRRFQAGLQNVGYQAQDTAVQIAGGTSAVRAFSQQLPQAIGALSTMFKEGSKLAAFFGGPWGVGIGVAVAVLLPLIDKLFDTAHAANEASAALQNLSNMELTQKRIEANLKLQKAMEQTIALEKQVGQSTATYSSTVGGSVGMAGQGQSRRADIAASKAEEEQARQTIKWLDVEVRSRDAAEAARVKATKATRDSTASVKDNTKAVQDNAAAQEELLQQLLRTPELPIANQLDAWEQQHRITEDQIKAIYRLNNVMIDFTDGALQKYIEESNRFWGEDGAGGRGAVDIINGMGDAFGSAASGAQSFGSAFEDMGKMVVKTLVEIAAKWVIIQAITSIFGGSSTMTSVTKALGFAKGGAFLEGRPIQVKPYAKGGVVSSPTLFPMANGAGLMGEAGPEAVMPLQRTSDGRLGVSSTAPTVNVSVQNYSGADVRVQQDGENIAIIVEQAKKAVAADIARGDGNVSAAIQSTYKLGRGR